MKRIHIKSPTKLCEYANKVITSWKLTYIGRDNACTYHYTLTDKENNEIIIGVEIHNETQQMYDPMSGPNEEWVKIYCKDINQPLKRGCTKFLRVEEFKDVKRVFNTIHHAGRQLLQ